MDLVGHYRDHSMSDPYTMAVESALVKLKMRRLADQDLLLLTTCLRVELYGSYRKIEQASPEILGNPRGILPVATDVVQRIAEITAGVHSQILGESYIAEQVTQAVGYLKHESALRYVAEVAIEIGRAAQRRHAFYATANYDRIVQDLVDEDLGAGQRGQTLYIVGAGMLGRSILASPLHGRFDAIRMISRDPKSVRKKCRHIHIPSLGFCQIDDLDPSREPNSVFLVATNDVSETYRQSLEALIARIEPRAIIELSSLPTLSTEIQNSETYTNMYSARFLSFLETNNRLLNTRRNLVMEDIRSSLRAARLTDARRIA